MFSATITLVNVVIMPKFTLVQAEVFMSWNVWVHRFQQWDCFHYLPIQLINWIEKRKTSFITTFFSTYHLVFEMALSEWRAQFKTSGDSFATNPLYDSTSSWIKDTSTSSVAFTSRIQRFWGIQVPSFTSSVRFSSFFKIVLGAVNKRLWPGYFFWPGGKKIENLTF